MRKRFAGEKNNHIIEQILEESKPLHYSYRLSGNRYVVFVRTREQSQIEKIVCDLKNEGYTATAERRLPLKKKNTSLYRTRAVIPRGVKYQIPSATKNRFQLTKIVVAPPPPQEPVPPMPDPNGEKKSKKRRRK